MSRVGTAVVGGGLAGSATALALARRGHDVTVFERDPTPSDKVCGEFLSEEGCHELQSLGLDLSLLGAEPIDRLRLLAGGRSVSCLLPFRAMTMSRRLLDPELRRLAAAAGARIRVGARVTGAGQGEVRLAAEHIAVDRVVLASGKLEVRNLKRRSAAGGPHDRIGLKMHYRPGDAVMASLRGTIVLCFFPGGYAGLVPLGADTCNFSAAVTRGAWDACGRDYFRLCRAIVAECPALAPVFADGAALWSRPVAVGHVPYGYRIWTAPSDPGWLWRVGDQAAVTPSLSGTGMTMALCGARILAGCIADGHSQGEYARHLRQAFDRPMWFAERIEAVFRGQKKRQAISLLVDYLPGLLTLSARLTRVGA